ncbi:MAG TPA: hypothetical protein H9962_06855 [Candidatus Mailhella merdigallinarum]|uniref:Cyanophage baseplate Pam3 plug gp18 domain-containing protein n=1 Tax=Candidatus Mailhella merdigallinarum TaxID=2838658 RepID=A0A9D2HEU6_9BACT|nr:hypothetical protein [Candidatus Mailhella merdigallinarum]
MALLEIPLRAEPSQALSLVLGGQDVTLRLFTRDMDDRPRLYCDLMASGVWVWRGRLCHNGQGLKLYDYLPFEGDLVFVDMQADADPQWSGLGDRWRLVWGTDADWAALLADKEEA